MNGEQFAAIMISTTVIFGISFINYQVACVIRDFKSMVVAVQGKITSSALEKYLAFILHRDITLAGKYANLDILVKVEKWYSRRRLGTGDGSYFSYSWVFQIECKSSTPLIPFKISKKKIFSSINNSSVIVLDEKKYLIYSDNLKLAENLTANNQMKESLIFLLSKFGELEVAENTITMRKSWRPPDTNPRNLQKILDSIACLVQQIYIPKQMGTQS